jgi:hypothetical protein
MGGADAEITIDVVSPPAVQFGTKLASLATSGGGKTRESRAPASATPSTSAITASALVVDVGLDRSFTGVGISRLSVHGEPPLLRTLSMRMRVVNHPDGLIGRAHPRCFKNRRDPHFV